MAHSQKETPFTTFEILPNLFLSRFPEDIPREITHVLNMCTTPNVVDSHQNYLHIALDDIDDITPYIPQIVDFISQALNTDGKILLHCALGLNRSIATIISYLCHQTQINSSDALKLVQTKKPNVKPCALFLKQIDRFFGREHETEDPLVGFHRRLQQRKVGS